MVVSQVSAQHPTQLPAWLDGRETPPVVILGAGLSGLSCALELQERGIEYALCERLDRVGGHARTDAEHGFRFDRTGHLLHLRSPRWRERVLGWLGQDVLQLERRSLVFSNGVYTRYPYQANTQGLPADVAYECLLGFVKAQLAQSESHSEQARPSNFEEYCLYHFGAGFSRHFMLPYNTKLWGVPPRELGVDWCERFVPRPRLEDVLAGAVGLPDRKLGYNASFLYPKLGIGQLPDAMAQRVRGLHLNCAPTRLVPSRRELWFGERRIQYRALVSTLPLPTLLDAVHSASEEGAAKTSLLPDAVASAKKLLRATSLRYLDLALKHPACRSFHWAYVPEPRLPFYRVGSYSAFSDAMAPPGKSSLYVELASRSARPLEQDLTEVLPGLREMGLLEGEQDLEFARARSLEYAYVLYDQNHTAALTRIVPYLEEHAIVSTGRYGGWNYSSMEDALDFGARAAAQAHAWLERSS